MPRVIAVDRSKLLVGNIVKDLRARQPLTDHAEGVIVVGKSAFLINNDSQNANTSRISVKGAKADINNETGEITVSEKPLFMFMSTVKANFQSFLEKIQPSRLATARVIDTEKPSRKGLTIVSETLELEGEKIQRIVTGYNDDFSPTSTLSKKSLPA